MDASLTRKQRLNQLLDLAQVYKGWNRRELARALGRDPTKLVPQSGNPKLDLVVDLASVLDWSVGDVARTVWVEDDEPDEVALDDDAVAELDREAVRAHRDGDYDGMIELARRAYAAARTPQARAIACNREAGGWDGLGRYTNLLEAVQRGLQETDISTDVRLMLQSNLSNAYYCLWHLFEARATARELIVWFDEHPPTARRDRWTHAFAYYVRGNALRRLMTKDAGNADHHGHRARNDLEMSAELFSTLAEQYENPSVLGIANTCRGGILEIDAMLGLVEPYEALDRLVDGLGPVANGAEWPVGDWLESYGWWCIFGCNIALEHLREKDQQQQMAVFTRKADEIASRLGHWAMRERVLTMEYARRQKLADWTGMPASDWAIDSDDVRTIVGTMGRFPSFQHTGWKILHTARVVREN